MTYIHNDYCKNIAKIYNNIIDYKLEITFTKGVIPYGFKKKY